MVNKLQQRGSDFSLVLNDNELDLFKTEKYINGRIQKCLPVKFIASLKHDSDFDEYGHRKTIHYHVVLVLRIRCTVGSLIKILSDLFHCNENQISCEKCSDVCMQVRYLVHKDDLDKTQYLAFDIESNNQMAVINYMSKQVDVVDTTDIDVICDKYHFNFREIAKCLGHKQFKQWLWYIQATKRDLYR